MLKSMLMAKLMVRHTTTAFVALLLLVSAAGAGAQNSFIAQSGDTPDQAEQQVENPQISQRRALELVRARFPGNVISINPVQQRGALLYRIRMDDNGNIFTLYVNAATGAITREQ